MTTLHYTTEQEHFEQAAAARQAAAAAQAQLAAGTVDMTTVLTTEQTLLADEDILAQVRLNHFLALVSLYKALGGGWRLPAGTLPF